MTRYFSTEFFGKKLKETKARKPRKAAGRPRRFSAKREEDFFHVANLMWGMPEVGKGADNIRANYRQNPDATLKLRNVKGWLLRSEAGQKFIALAMRHGYETSNCFNLYRRYAHWYFRQEADHANQAASGTDRTGA